MQDIQSIPVLNDQLLNIVGSGAKLIYANHDGTVVTFRFADGSMAHLRFHPASQEWHFTGGNTYQSGLAYACGCHN